MKVSCTLTGVEAFLFGVGGSTLVVVSSAPCRAHNEATNRTVV